MYKKFRSLGVIAWFAAVLCVAGVAPVALAAADGAHTSRNSLSWAGSYRGTILCAACKGVTETVVTLQQDGRYQRQWRVEGEFPSITSKNGRFRWSEDGGSITLSDGDQFLVGEKRLILLGAQAPDNLLTQLPAPTFAGTRWELTEFDGKPVAASEHPAHLVFDAENSTVSGTGGCNRLHGGYTLTAPDALKFSPIAASMMACAYGGELEFYFLQALGKVTQFRINGEQLVLMDAEAKPLMVLTAAYLY